MLSRSRPLSRTVLQHTSALRFPPLGLRPFTRSAPRLEPSHRTPSALVTALKRTGFFFASATGGIFLIGGAIFLHDAFTYNELHVERVPVNPLALRPELGGPKNLPVANVLMADEEDDVSKRLADKPKLVIVGGGWGVEYCYFSHALSPGLVLTAFIC